VFNLTRLQPRLESIEEEGIVKIFTPEAAILHTSLGKAAVEIQHADETGRVIARLVEVAFVPNILRADAVDIERESLAAGQKSRCPQPRAPTN